MAGFDDDVYFATIGELSAKLRAREFTARELAEAFVKRLEERGPRYNALAVSMGQAASRAARDVDGDLKRERFRSPLQGIPFAVKDLLAVRGHPTTWGARPFAAQVLDYDATAVRKLTGVGGILTGKLAMVELAGGGGYRIAGASMFGPGLNPWDPAHWSGGSSSGSGSAVAAGLVPYALGSETSGSILTPAAFCGVTGLRPTYGLVSRYGAMPLSWTLDKIGPMCRSAEDCGLVLQAISGGDSNDPGSAGKSFFYAPQYQREMKDIKVGFAPADWSDLAAEEARPAFQEAFGVMKSIGIELKEVKLPDYAHGPLVGTIIGAEAASIFEEFIRSGQVNQLEDPYQIAGLKASLDISAGDYLRAQRVRTRLRADFRKLFADVEVLLAPARYSPAPKVAEPLTGPAGGDPPADPGMSGLIPAGNLCGFPALSVPCGFAGKLPVGLQLVGRPYTENLLLAVGNEFQKRTDWHRKRPI